MKKKFEMYYCGNKISKLEYVLTVVCSVLMLVLPVVLLLVMFLKK